mgnify:CR=1 FL=1
MSCENERQTWTEADQALTASLLLRASAEESQAEAAEALKAANSELESAQTSVETSAQAAADAYAAYTACVTG